MESKISSITTLFLPSMFKTAYLSIRKGKVGVRERATETEVLSQAGKLVFRRLLHGWLCHSMRQSLSMLKSKQLTVCSEIRSCPAVAGSPPFLESQL